MATHRITPDDWLQPDPLSERFFAVRDSGLIELPDGQAWAKQFLSFDLSERCPESLRAMLAVATGAMSYGWFFYPMYELGITQLMRMADAAVEMRCAQLEFDGRSTLFQRLNWLHARGVLSSAQLSRWDDLRKGRNSFVHASGGAVLPPGTALGMIEWVVAAVDELFEETR